MYMTKSVHSCCFRVCPFFSTKPSIAAHTFAIEETYVSTKAYNSKGV